MARSRSSVRALLIGGNVALVLAAVIAVAAAGASLLSRRADDEALARVSAAGAGAAREIERSRERLGASVRAFAGQPALAALLRSADRDQLADRLEAFRQAGALRACALVYDTRVYAFAGQAVAWDELLSAGATALDGLQRIEPGSRLVLAATATVSDAPGPSVVGVLALDDAFRARLSEQVGLPVVLIDRESARASAGVPGSAREARGRALDSESEVAAPIRETGSYLAVQPLRASSGALVGFLETTLPGGATARSARRAVRSLVSFSIVVAGLALGLGILLARRLVEPLEALTEASARIGRGELATVVPGRDSTELGSLAGSLDAMRARLMVLTSELRMRQAQADAVAAGMLEGVFAVDRERTIRFVNPQGAGLLGLPSAQIIGRFCGDVLKPRMEGGVRPCDDRCPILHARFRGSTRAVEHLAANGGTRAVVITSAGPEAGDGESGMQFQVIRDESDTEATRRLRDAVLANISHEFRTPLSAQLASIELLRDRLDQIEPKEVRDLVLTLERGTLRLTQLIDNLLESVRIESGADSIRRRPVALDEVIEAAVDLTSPLAALREQAIHVDLPYPIPGVEGDAPRLVQVFVNLLANASKFAPTKTAIRIGGEVHDREVVVWVEDEGPGLPEEEEAPRFERFYRSPGEEPEESGMGLGLFIVKSIVERHGGRVEVRGGAREGDSGKRTRMCVVLPAREDAS